MILTRILGVFFLIFAAIYTVRFFSDPLLVRALLALVCGGIGVWLMVWPRRV